MFKSTRDGMDDGSAYNCQKECERARGDPARRYTNDHEAANESQMLCQLGKKRGKHRGGYINGICSSGFLSDLFDHGNPHESG
jgi:hypothetical protein